MQYIARYALAATILAVGMVASSALISRFFVRVQQQKEIRVTGYAEAPITSDTGQLSVEVSVQNTDRTQAYRAVREQADGIADRIRKGAPADAQVVLENADLAAVNRRDDKGTLSAPTALTVPAAPQPASEPAEAPPAMGHNEKGEPTGLVAYYVASQSVRVSSSDVGWIGQLSWDINQLNGQGYNVQVQPPTFLVSKLDGIKRDLLEKATADGYARAQMVAKNSGARVGHLLAARQGVFQITEPNSTETSGYGTYDTSTIMKSIKAVVDLEYAVE